VRRADLLVAGAAVALYAPTWGHFFVSDDFLNLERSIFRTVAEGLALFSARDVDFYRPLARLHFGVMAGLFSDRVLVWNVANTLLHAACAVVARRLAASLLGPAHARAATATGLLFALHFLHVEPVVWASGVATLLAALFVMLALAGFRRARETGRPRHLALSALAFGAALMSQEAAVAFVPLLLWTTWVWPPGRGPGSGRLPRLGEAAPYAVLLLAYAAVATSIDRGGAASPYRVEAGAHVVKNVAFFALGGFVPVRYWEIQELWAARGEGGLAAFVAALASRPLLGVPLLAAAALAPLALRRGGRDVLGGIGMIAAAALPFLLLPGSGERFHYLPSLGACLTMGLAAEALFRPATRASRRRAVAVSAVGLGAMTAAAADRQADWILAGRWTRELVDRWSYFRRFEADAPVEFVGVADRWRSAWVFRNGFPSMVRLYWEGRPYRRAEERTPDSPPAYRVRVVARPDGSLGVEPVRGAERDAERPRITGEEPAPPGGGEAPGDASR
jgi:hypothetical protein